MYAGAATTTITPPLGTPIQGASVDNVAGSVRDELEANALYLEADGAAVLLVNCDLVGISDELAAAARPALAAAAGLDEDRIVLFGTHTHNGPVLIWTNPRKPVDPSTVPRLLERLVPLARQAREAAQPARLAWGKGQARLGYNRRCCWADGTHSMHGDGNRPDFTGLEGPDDPTHSALFAESLDGRLLAILHHNTSHPTCFYGRDFFSADFPGEARAQLRHALGSIPVLYMNGAFGDISIGSQLSKRPGGGEISMRRAGLLAAGETLRLYHQAAPRDEVTLVHIRETLELAVRLPEPARLAWARDVRAKIAAGASVHPWDSMMAHGIVTLQEAFGDRPIHPLRLHLLRLGELAIVTQPCELYCQFGLDIKRRSPWPMTLVGGIADGYAGYVPTAYGSLGGGYSGEPIWWTRFAPDGGYRLVDAASRLLRQ